MTANINCAIAVDPDRQDQSAAVRAELVGTLPTLRRFAISLCKSGEQADDLVQETALRALTCLHQFKPGTNMTAWLFTILRHIFINRARRQRRETVYQAEFASLASESCNPSQIGYLDCQDFCHALSQIPVPQQRALLLVGALGMSLEQAAKICSCTEGTIKSRVHRARARVDMKLN